MAKGAWSKLAALCACTVAAAALSSCGAVAKKEPQAQAAATAENSAVLRAVTVVDGDSLTLEGQTLCADEADQSVLVVKNGGSVVLRNCTITKTGGTADSASAIEGVNAALVAQSGGNLVLENCTIETDGKGASALAAVGDNACVVVSDTTITTRQEASAGVMAAANGCILAQNLAIETQGAYSPMLYAGTGSGTIQASGVEGRSSGAYAPCVYSRGTLTLEDSEMVAYASACAVLEGANSLSLTQTALESQGSEMGVLVFQPDAGQAEQTQADSGMAELWVSGGPGRGAVCYQHGGVHLHYGQRTGAGRLWRGGKGGGWPMGQQRQQRRAAGFAQRRGHGRRHRVRQPEQRRNRDGGGDGGKRQNAVTKVHRQDKPMPQRRGMIQP